MTQTMTEGYSQTVEEILGGTFALVRDENPSRVLYTYAMHQPGTGKRAIEVVRVFIYKTDSVTGSAITNPQPQIGWSSLDACGADVVTKFAAALNHAAQLKA